MYLFDHSKAITPDSEQSVLDLDREALNTSLAKLRDVLREGFTVDQARGIAIASIVIPGVESEGVEAYHITDKSYDAQNSKYRIVPISDDNVELSYVLSVGAKPTRNVAERAVLLATSSRSREDAPLLCGVKAVEALTKDAALYFSATQPAS